MKQKLKQDNITEESNKNENIEIAEKSKTQNSEKFDKIKKIWNKVNPIIEKVVNAIIPLIIALFIEGFYFAVNTGTFGIDIINRKAFAFSVLLIYVVYIMLLGITKKTSTTVNVLLFFTYIILIINQIKIIYTGEPVAISDINFLFRLGEIAELTSTTLIAKSWEYILVFIELGICFFLIMILAKKYNKEINGLGKRLSCAIIGIIMIGLLFFPNKSMKEFYLKTVFNIDTRDDYDTQTTNLSFYNKYTFLSGLWEVSLNNIFSEPHDYNKKELNEQLENISKSVESNKDWGKPNIILVFSESFWDVDKISEVEFSQKVTADLDEIRKNGTNVNLLTCTYGGLSENVAFELLTGGSMNYFSNSYIPIVSLYRRKNIANAPSIVKNLNQNGYYSKIVFGKDYYQSNLQFKKMGFDEYVEYEETDENKKGEYISDEFITDKIIEELKSKGKDKKLFFMAETIQSHMPYMKDRYEKYDIEIEKSTLSEDFNKTILSYAQGIYDASKQVNRLYQYIKNYDEPTMIIFLGDHLPYLYTEEGQNVIDHLSYFNTDDDTENIFRKYNTEAFIVANYDIDYSNVPKYFSDDMLLTYIINQMDIDVDKYYKYLYSTINLLPAVNKFIVMDSNGNKYNLTDMNEQMKMVYEHKEKMQYRLFIDI